ncbi:MAG: transposase [Chloroflexi bacterium]|nr:transposase [Chloroflexota bacterium]
MENYPRSLTELEQRFSTEEACREYLFQLRWSEGFRCPVCGHSEAWKLKGGLFKCTACTHKTPVIAGTLFYRLLQNTVALDAASYQDITKGVRGTKVTEHNM